MWIHLLALLPVIVYAQNGEEVVENAENFRRLYGIATKIMELSGNIMNGNGEGNEIRPRFQGVRSFTEDNSILSGGSSSGNSGINSMAQMFQQYGGMLANTKFVQATTTTTQAPTGFKSIIDSFLGTGNSQSAGGGGGDDFENLPPPPTPRPRPRQQNLFGGLFGGGQTESNVAPAPQPSAQTANMAGNLMNLFGLGPAPTPPPTTTTTTEATPVQRIMNLFVPQQERPQPEQSSSRGRINILEMFGLAKPTTTTTAAPPLRALFAPDKSFSGTAEDIDGLMNALLRTNARPARQEPSSILSQFFGGRK